MKLDESRITIQYDNKQIIRLVNEDIATLQIKLRHIDIHNHWLRQKALKGRIKVKYTPTDDMITDGLIKVLSAKGYRRFIQQVRLINIKERILYRRLKKLRKKDFLRI